MPFFSTINSLRMIDGNEMLELIISRQSDRKYSDTAVEKEKLERIIEAGRMSPSASNAQPWKFVIVTEHELILKIAEAASEKIIGMNSFVGQAPVLIVMVREQPNFSSKVGGLLMNRDYSHIDLGIAAANICNQAEAEGLGSCMIGWFNERQVKKILGVPRFKRIELLITIGYSASRKKEKRRKPYDATVSFNKY